MGLYIFVSLYVWAFVRILIVKVVVKLTLINLIKCNLFHSLFLK